MLNKNNNFKYILSITIILLSYGCSTNKESHLYLRECIKNKTDNSFIDIYGDNKIDVYDMVDSIEKNLMLKGIIKNLNKEEYLRLVDYVKKENSILTENKVINEFTTISSLIVVDLVATCNYEVIIKQKNKLNSSIVNQFKNSENLFATGYNFDLIEKHIETTYSEDFKHIEYRAPIMVMLLYHLDKIKFKNTDELKDNK